jgi:hypothetical protein
LKRLITLALLTLALGAALALPAAAAGSGPPAGAAQLRPFDGSGVTGAAALRQLTPGGTAIRVVAAGLQPGHRYISLYYGNPTCTNPDFADQIGGAYTADAAGVGRTQGAADDDLGGIRSVSVRDATTHQKLACGVVTRA